MDCTFSNRFRVGIPAPSGWGRVALLAMAAVVLVMDGHPTALRAQGVGAEIRPGGATGSYSARAGGAYAVARNPAALAPGAAGTDGGTIAPDWILPSIGVRGGLEPVTLGDLAEYSGRAVPAAAREAWLDRIERDGGQSGVAETLFTVLALRRGRWGASWTTSARADVALNPNAAEALLFGNAGRAGVPAELAFEGSAVDAWAASTLSVGAGARLEELGAGSWAEGLSAGATLSWTLGHAFLTGRDAGSTLDDEPVSLDGVFPVVRSELEMAAGRGLSLDVALRALRGSWTVVLHAEGVLSSFDWSDEALVYRPGVALLGPDTSETYSPALPLSSAPGSIQERVAAFELGRALTLGMARALNRGWLMADGTCVFDVGESVARADCVLSTGYERFWGDRWRAAVGTQVGDGGLALGLGATVRVGPMLLEGSAYRRFLEREEIGFGFGGALRTR